MKKILFIWLAALFIGACSEKIENINDEEKVPLCVSPCIITSKATINYALSDYFTIADYGWATVTVKNGDFRDTSVYRYQNEKFSAPDEGSWLWIPKAGQADSVTISWPAQSQRTEIPRDQSDKAVFLSADWLRGEALNVAPAEFTSVLMKHERAKLTFTLKEGGVNSEKRIKSLTVNGYTAYADTTKSGAELIVDDTIWESFKGTTGGIFRINGENKDSGFIMTGLDEYKPGENYIIPINL